MLAMSEKRSIILIGPMSAGKSSIAQLLSEQLALPWIEVDEMRWDYFEETGYDHEKVKAMMDAGGGYAEMFAYWKPFEVHALERVLQDHDRGIFDFGAGYTVQEDEALFARVQNAFAPFEDLFLLLPSPDVGESLEVLDTRLTALLEKELGSTFPEAFELNEHLIRHPSNQQLAQKIVYTADKTPEECCLEIIALLKKA